MRKRKATKRPQPAPADRTLEELGGIAGLLQTLAGAWPKKLPDFEAVFDLVVRRCRNEFGASRFLAYLCRALLHERARQKIGRTVPAESWALAAERVNLTAFEAFQAPSFAKDIALARALAEAIHDPGPTSGPLGPFAAKHRGLMRAAGGRLLSPPKGSHRGAGVKRRRKPMRPDPRPGLERALLEVRRARSAETLESTISNRLGLPPVDAARVAEWTGGGRKGATRVARALLAAEEEPSLVGKGLPAIRAAERNIYARERRWARLREREKTDTHLSRA